MSVKIFNAFIANTMDPFEAERSIRVILDAEYYRRFNAIVREYSEMPDDVGDIRTSYFFPTDVIIPTGIRASKYNGRKLIYNGIKRLHGSSENTGSDADIMWDVSLIRSQSDGNVLGLVFGGLAGDYTSVLLASGVVGDYSYWDNADRPDGVSEEEWNQRREAWNSLIEGSNTPASVGLSFSNPGRIDTILQSDAINY